MASSNSDVYHYRMCLRTGVSEEELTEIVGLGMIEPHQPQAETWLFDDSAVTMSIARCACVTSWSWTGRGSRWR